MMEESPVHVVCRMSDKGLIRHLIEKSKAEPQESLLARIGERTDKPGMRRGPGIDSTR